MERSCLDNLHVQEERVLAPMIRRLLGYVASTRTSQRILPLDLCCLSRDLFRELEHDRLRGLETIPRLEHLQVLL
jgi:hypothetical protein